MNDVHLSLAGGGPLYGRFTREVGSAIVPVSDTFVIFDGGSGFGHFMRAAWNPDTRQFLVVFQNGVAQQYGILQSRVVSFTQPGYLVGGTQTLSDAGIAAGTRVESEPAIAYSTVAHRYIAAWVTPTFGLFVRLLDANGIPTGAPIAAETGGTHSVAVTAHPTGNYFGLANTAFGATSAWAAFRLVDGSGNVSQRSSVGASAGTYAIGVDVNSGGQYVMSWGVQPGTWTAMFDANGSYLAGPTFVSGRIGGDLSMGLAYNEASKTFLVVSSDWDSYEIAGAELSQQGSPVTSVRAITDGAGRLGSFYPVPVERDNSDRWNVTYSRGYAGSVQQMVASGGTSTPPPSSPPPTTPSTGCTTPDPFTAIGGGTCVNGGWRPGGGTPTPTPPPTTPTPPSTPSTCTTSDPFAAIGGGTCVNGGWVPGVVAPAPNPTPIPAPTPTPTSSTCATPDPFVVIGGGTCVNGGWVPGVVAPPPSSTPPPSTPTPSSSCSTPDPFGAIGGGTCVSGGWVPGRASSSSCSGPDPFATTGGGVCVNGGWVPGAIAGGCLTADPFASIGGGVCVAGGWVPRGGH